MILDEERGEAHFKIACVGPVGAGRTTTLGWHHRAARQRAGAHPSVLIRLATQTERMLFFDFTSNARWCGHRVMVHLFASPGSRRLPGMHEQVLRGADAILFVADSWRPRMAANLEQRALLDGDSRPLVVQYNKRDQPDVVSIETLQDALRPLRGFATIATTGRGLQLALDAAIMLARRSPHVRVPDDLAAFRAARLRREPATPVGPPAPEPRQSRVRRLSRSSDEPPPTPWAKKSSRAKPPRYGMSGSLDEVVERLSAILGLPLFRNLSMDGPWASDTDFRPLTAWRDAGGVGDPPVPAPARVRVVLNDPERGYMTPGVRGGPTWLITADADLWPLLDAAEDVVRLGPST